MLHPQLQRWTIAEVSKLSVKGQTVSSFHFIGHTDPVTTAQLCPCRSKAAIDSRKTNGQ